MRRSGLWTLMEFASLALVVSTCASFTVNQLGDSCSKSWPHQYIFSRFVPQCAACIALWVAVAAKQRETWDRNEHLGPGGWECFFWSWYQFCPLKKPKSCNLIKCFTKRDFFWPFLSQEKQTCGADVFILVSWVFLHSLSYSWIVNTVARNGQTIVKPFTSGQSSVLLEQPRKLHA